MMWRPTCSPPSVRSPRRAHDWLSSLASGICRISGTFTEIAKRLERFDHRTVFYKGIVGLIGKGFRDFSERP
jgi:hypothetical protein